MELSRQTLKIKPDLAIGLFFFLVSLNSSGLVAKEPSARAEPARNIVRLKQTLGTGEAETYLFSPVSKLIALGKPDHTVQIWSAAAGKLVQTLAGFKRSGPMSWSPDGQRLLIPTSDRTASVWNVQTGEKLCELTGRQFAGNDITWRLDGKTVLLLIRHGGFAADLLDRKKTEVQLWDTETGQLEFRLSIPGIWARAIFSPDGQRILTTGGEREEAKIWDARTGQRIAALSPTSRSYFDGGSGLFSPDGRVIALTKPELGIYLFDAATGKLQASLFGRGFGDSHYSLRGFSPDSQLLVLYREHFKTIGHTESSIELRDGVNGELRFSLTGVNMMYAANQLVWSPDGQTLVTGGGNKKYDGKIWNAGTGTLRATFPMIAKEGRVPMTSYYNDLDRLSFLPSCPIIMAASNDFIRFWDPATGALLQRLDCPNVAAQWSTDGSLLVVWSSDRKSVLMWELER